MTIRGVVDQLRSRDMIPNVIFMPDSGVRVMRRAHAQVTRGAYIEARSKTFHVFPIDTTYSTRTQSGLRRMGGNGGDERRKVYQKRQKEYTGNC